uniref:Uncharacterized protein n=1 Tax=Siphoviridae sp. ct5jB2 TaxID=2825337 RepID=A0A8S5TTE2_9CAUD|nr:MAG TPA: hypothetical protein [Siphoviridae sp. ct5jB2]
MLIVYIKGYFIMGYTITLYFYILTYFCRNIKCYFYHFVWVGISIPLDNLYP